MQKSLAFKVEPKIYPYHIVFSINQTDDEVRKVMKKFKMDLDINTYLDYELRLGRCTQDRSGNIFIRLRYFPDEYARRMATLAHEIFHAVEFIMSRIGITLSDSSDEAFAYMISFITEEVYKKLGFR